MLEQVLSCFRTRTVPILLGEPGVGKSAFARAVAAKLGGISFFVCLSHKEATEVHGLPIVSRELVEVGDKRLTVVQQAPPDYALAAHKAEVPVVIVYDELTCVPPTTAAPTLAILGDRRVADLDLDPNRVALIACANPEHLAAGGWSLPAPMANRLVWLDYKLSAQDWAENFPSYWGNPPQLGFGDGGADETAWSKARTLVASFIRSKPDMLIRVPTETAKRSAAWPSPRTWDYLSRILADADVYALADSVRSDLMCGCIGAPAAVEFLTWMEDMDLPNPSDLIDDPTCFVLPKRSDQVYYVVMGVVAEASNRKRKSDGTSSVVALRHAQAAWQNAWVILDAVVKKGGPTDVAAIGARQLANPLNHPKGAAPPPSVRTFAAVLKAAGVSWAEVK